ncbi:MAG: pirin family protein [Pseudomonadota bacterium]
MKYRHIQEVRAAHPSQDGDGVAIHRVAGMRHAAMDPILMIDELRSQNRTDFGGGFPAHPHRGMQTLTYLKQGGIIHEDNLGNRGEIRGGGAQWMSAGRGIIHSEMPTSDTDGLHGFQLWVNLARRDKMSAPQYRDMSMQELTHAKGNGWQATAIAGSWHIAITGDDGESLRGPLNELAQRASILDLSLQPDTVVELRVPDSESVLGYIYDGSVLHAGSDIGFQRLLVTGRGDTWRLQAGTQGASLLVMRGEPLAEPVAHYGPFVMNTPAEIEQALREYQAGTFVTSEPMPGM